MSSAVAVLLVPLLPLLAALLGFIAAAQGRRVPARLAGWLGLGSLGGSALLAAQLIASGGSFSCEWFRLPDTAALLNQPDPQASFSIPFALSAQPAPALFMLTVALISCAVLLFALRERADDPRAPQFYATLTLFAGSMLLFLSSDTLLVLYIAWELMGLCSYLLIAHPATAEARRAARQAFWTTRATDFGLLFAILILMTNFQWMTVSAIDVSGLLSRIAQAGGDWSSAQAWMSAVAVLALLACLGKAAQLPLSFWLPDAMVAPAPVSALLHAAAMVAAGPFLLVRLHVLFSTSQLPLVLCVLLGGLTLLGGGLMALAARDAKRVLAYSTLSQLGLVVMAVGALSEEAGFYHLLAHAWFKAPLFLAVGYLALAAARPPAEGGEDATPAHGASLEQLSGSGRDNGLVRWTLLLAGLSLAGLWPLAGALGKEQLLYALLTRHNAEPSPGAVLGQHFPLAAAAWTIGAGLFILALPVTAAYATRLVGLLVWGPKPAHAETRPLPGFTPGLGAALLLAVIGSAGWAALFPWFHGQFSSESSAWKWMPEGSPLAMLCLVLSLLFGAAGAVLTWQLRIARPELGRKVLHEGGMAPLIAFFADGMRLREFFLQVVARSGEGLAVLAGRAELGLLDWLALRCGAGGRLLARGCRWVDEHVVDGLRCWACELFWWLKRLHSRYLQTGQIQHYMFIVLLSTALLCLIVLKPLADFFGRMMGRP
jgi:NADH-quinone oxidoreductase subunit L